MMIWTVKLYIMADAQPSPPPSPPSANGTHSLGGFHDDDYKEEEKENEKEKKNEFVQQINDESRKPSKTVSSFG